MGLNENNLPCIFYILFKNVNDLLPRSQAVGIQHFLRRQLCYLQPHMSPITSDEE